ncbi:immunoglobulin-like and fibronectin type III domain-containing protein 1 isoform X2 [Protopterus annectens]|uniref:immunoglobulin-like and fibronectin type III domain-containing protein 1 isoform X2 n=1 Tax=Protopterus annectens TaxID=7888 RepID=UPI001CF9F3A8|nr:immunoglobulin-like and fibronectin type III domain-containing protein 1 isoform X2 [Protopterus annectens]
MFPQKAVPPQGNPQFIKKKSSVPGVNITQFVPDGEIPEGCSTPDFERKPIPLTIQEGKNAIFKAAIKGKPKPEITWTRNKGDLSNTARYKMGYDRIMEEFTLQIQSVTPEDADTYKCFARNEYGEAVSVAGLIVIEVGFKKKAKQPKVQKEEICKDPVDFRKMLKKRAPAQTPKQEKVVDEKFWERLMKAEKKDYEHICREYGITDFRWILKKLQQMKEDKEDKQSKYINAIHSLKHIQVNKQGIATFEIEMELKDPNSRIFLYKNGQLINYGNDTYKKHYLRQIGKRYCFNIQNLLIDDAGTYQVNVEDIPIFSTELDPLLIPVTFKSQLKEVCCQERENAIFECTLSWPYPGTVWLYKKQKLGPGDKYEMSVSPDGLTHRLTVKDTRLIDKGIYAIEAGISSSSAWLIVNAANDDAPGTRDKRKHTGGAENDADISQDNDNYAKRKRDLMSSRRCADVGDQDGFNDFQVKDALQGFKKNYFDASDKAYKDKGTVKKDASEVCQDPTIQGRPGGSSNDVKDGFNEQISKLGGMNREGFHFEPNQQISQKGLQAQPSDMTGDLQHLSDSPTKDSGSFGAKLDLKTKTKGGPDMSKDDKNRVGKNGLEDNNDTDRLMKHGLDGTTEKHKSTYMPEPANIDGKSKHTDKEDGNGGTVFQKMHGKDELDGNDVKNSFLDGPEVFPGQANGGKYTGSTSSAHTQDKAHENQGMVLNGTGSDSLGSGYGATEGDEGYSNSKRQQGRRSGHNSTLINEENQGNKDKKIRRRLDKDDPTVSASHFTSGLSDLHVQKGHNAELRCELNTESMEGTWFKDGKKLTPTDGVIIGKEGAVHTLIITNASDKDAGQYRFEAGSIKTHASLFIKDPPQVEEGLLQQLAEKPLVVKAGQNTTIKVPFAGRRPIKVTWNKDGDELLEDNRIRVEKADNFTRLSISSCQRKDSGNLQLKLKNDSGTTDVDVTLLVIDKPQPPQGPVEVLESSAKQITIRWKPPKDDGGCPLQQYTIERQQVGRNTWIKVGEVDKNTTIFSTNKVEHGKKYCFKVRAVNSEGASDGLISEEVMAGTKAYPGPPLPPKIVNASSKAITLSWSAPQNTGGSRILGYFLEKRKKGSLTWTSVNEQPIPERKWTVTDVVEGLQYEFRVTALNTSGSGEPSNPSNAVFAREPVDPPGPVQDLRVTESSYSTISLSWLPPLSSSDEHTAKGYYVEVRAGNSHLWNRCNNSPLRTTSYTVKGLKAKEPYFLRVLAINEGGQGQPKELDTYVLAMPPPVRPQFQADANLKRFITVQAGNIIRVRIPFEGSPTPEVLWLKDGLPVSQRATTTTVDRFSQMLIPISQRSDSGLYSITLKNNFGQETFCFEIQVTDIPRAPGPVCLEENVPGTVTVSWEPSPDEKWDNRLRYMVQKRDSSQMTWQLVSDNIFNNKCTIINIIPGRQYYFRVLAKNDIGISEPSSTLQPWCIFKNKEKFTMRPFQYRQLDYKQAPRILAILKPHIVPNGFNCYMTCAVHGEPQPKITWYKNGQELSQNTNIWSSNIRGVCSLVIPCATGKDSGDYTMIAKNSVGKGVTESCLMVRE